MIGRTYLERGSPVTVLKRWGKGGGPRNVLIRRSDGSEVVRPFRGLRKVPEGWQPQARPWRECIRAMANGQNAQREASGSER